MSRVPAAAVACCFFPSFAFALEPSSPLAHPSACPAVTSPRSTHLSGLPKQQQVFLGCFEDLLAEREAPVRHRRLATALRIVRAAGAPAISLGKVRFCDFAFVRLCI